MVQSAPSPTAVAGLDFLQAAMERTRDPANRSEMLRRIFMRCPETLGYLSFSFDLAELRTLAKRNVGIRDRYELGVKQQSGPVPTQALVQQSKVVPD
jgi:hypothetical protein